MIQIFSSSDVRLSRLLIPQISPQISAIITAHRRERERERERVEITVVVGPYMPLLGIQLPGEMPPKTDLATNERNKREEKRRQRSGGTEKREEKATATGQE